MSSSDDLDCDDGIITVVSNATCTAEFRPEAIFSDGFESADTSAWSATVP
jgi:hypothetical protein